MGWWHFGACSFDFNDARISDRDGLRFVSLFLHDDAIAGTGVVIIG